MPVLGHHLHLPWNLHIDGERHIPPSNWTSTLIGNPKLVLV